MSLNVQALLANKIHKKYNDRLFWYASRVLINNDKVDVYIENSNLVTFDDINLNIKKISELKDNQQKNLKDMQNVLISSGSFLFINKKLVVTQRDLNTSFDPGFWTTPAGRCDRTILETGIKETIEEIKITNKNKILFPHIAKEFIEDTENIEFYDTSFKDDNFPLKTYNITLYLDNILIEKCKAWMYISHKVNTIEFRIPIFTKLNENTLTFTNPEFATDTGLKSIEELRGLNVVPALQQLLKEI